jgi:hypothetical protein
MKELTPAQQRYLTEIRASGKKVYNGRARIVINTLERAGLVTADWEMRFATKGNGTQPYWRITVWPIETTTQRRTDE